MKRLMFNFQVYRAIGTVERSARHAAPNQRGLGKTNEMVD